MKQEKAKGVINGVRKKWLNDTIEYEVTNINGRNSFYIEIVASKPEFSVGDIVEISIKQSYMKAVKC